MQLPVVHTRVRRLSLRRYTALNPSSLADPYMGRCITRNHLLRIVVDQATFSMENPAPPAAVGQQSACGDTYSCHRQLSK